MKKTKNTKKTDKAQKKQNKELLLKVCISLTVVLAIVGVILIVNSGKKIVCTKVLTNDISTIQITNVFKFDRDNKLKKISATAILNYSNEEGVSQEAFDEIVNKVNNTEKYEKVHISKYGKSATIEYQIKLSAANLGDDLTYDTLERILKTDESLGTCIAK